MPPDLQLAYAFDDEPGLQRRAAGKGFAYRDRTGHAVDRRTRKRIAGLVIPPAWTEVWICPEPNGHIQATGRDARGRKQYIYHPDWRQWRERSKFEHVLDFAAALPKLRRRVEEDLAERHLTRRLVLATAVRVLERTLMRVGNTEYARENGSYGLTTLLDDHVEQVGSRVHFSFRGKHGKPFDAEFSDRRVATVLRRLEGLPGQQLFQFVDADGNPHRISSEDINDYIREATGGDFTAKDFRTWAATVLAAVALANVEVATSEAGARRVVAKAIRFVAGRLGNTPAVCRASYVHPAVITSYAVGSLDWLRGKVEDLIDGEPDLPANERAVLRFLKSHAADPGPDAKKPATPVGKSLRDSLAAEARA